MKIKIDLQQTKAEENPMLLANDLYDLMSAEFEYNTCIVDEATPESNMALAEQEECDCIIRVKSL